MGEKGIQSVQVKETVWTRRQEDKMEDYSRHAQQTRGKGHRGVLMIKWPSRTERHNGAKAKAVSNLNRTAGLT